MKKLLVAIALSVLVVGCGGANATTASDKQKAQEIAVMEEILAKNEKFLADRKKKIQKIHLIVLRAINEGKESGNLTSKDLNIFSEELEGVFKKLNQLQPELPYKLPVELSGI